LIGGVVGLRQVDAGDVLRRRRVELDDGDRRARRLDALDVVLGRAIDRAADRGAGLAYPSFGRREFAVLLAVDLALADLAAEHRAAEGDRRLLVARQARTREIDRRDVTLGRVATVGAERLRGVDAVDVVAAAHRKRALLEVLADGEVAIIRVRELVRIRGEVGGR